MKNIEKYKFYESIIDKIANDFCISFFPDGVPEYMYDIHKNFSKHEHGYYIRKAKVTDISYRFIKEEKKPFYTKRPSNKAVLEIKQLSEILSETIDQSNVFIHFQEKGDIHNTSWATNYDDFISGELSINKDGMEPLLKKKIDFYISNYVLKENQFSCAYCWKATDNDKKTSRDIISRQYDNYRKSFDYCSIECASHDQMAHEG